MSRYGEGLPSGAQLTVDSFLWQEKEKEKDKIKEKEKESKEKEKDKKTVNGHSFSPIPIVGPISCSQCMKPFPNKDAYTCASKCMLPAPAGEAAGLPHQSCFVASFLCVPPPTCSSFVWRSNLCVLLVFKF